MASDPNARSGRRTAARVVLTAALFAVVVFAVDQLVPGASHRLAHASPGWLAIALGLEWYWRALVFLPVATATTSWLQARPARG